MAFKIKKKSKKTNNSTIDLNKLLTKEINLFNKSFSNKDKELFYSELYLLLNAGLELKESLEIIAKEERKKNNKDLINKTIVDLINGKNLSDSLIENKTFKQYEFYAIKIGEQTGKLKKVIHELSQYYKEKNEQKRTIINALSYPIVVIITAFLSLTFMLNFVVPMFADIFNQNKVELPWITKKIINTSKILQNNSLKITFGIVLLLLNLNLIKNKIWFKKISSNIILKIPFLGDLNKKIILAQFTQALSLLISAKIPILEGIQLTKKMIDFYPLQVSLKKIETDIMRGKLLHQSIKEIPFFDKKMSSLIKVAEETNQTEAIFNRLTQQYKQEIENKTKMISSILEPFIILILGGVVAIILIAMYLPMFKLSTVIN